MEVKWKYFLIFFVFLCKNKKNRFHGSVNRLKLELIYNKSVINKIINI